MREGIDGADGEGRRMRALDSSSSGISWDGPWQVRDGGGTYSAGRRIDLLCIGISV